jgi:hypothetical protein
MNKHRQRGAATLLVMVVLLFAMTLLAAFSNRNLVFEQRSASNVVRSTQAFEAAEAGADWAIAMLNQRRRIGADCLPSSRTEDLPFRERRLRYDAATQRHIASTWDDAGELRVLLASCLRDAAGWTCHCPSNGPPSLPAPSGGDEHALFSVELGAGPSPGLVRLVALGCTTGKAACSADPGARVEMLLGLVGGLATPPAAALTAKGDIDMAGTVGVHNAEAFAGAITVHSGGSVSLPAARLTTAPGGAAALSVVANDTALGASTADAFFTRYFGLDKTAWREQPMVQRIACAIDCAAALSAAAAQGSTLLWIDGDAAVQGPLVLGSAERPVILVASGTLQLRGGVVLTGLIDAANFRWDDTAGTTAAVRGAVMSQGTVQGSGAPDLVYDRAVLNALAGNSGSFAAVPGSWKDF